MNLDSVARETGATPASGAPVLDADAQYVTVGIDAEVFAIDVSQVREVLDLQPFTRVPNMPRFVRGMIDVRGRGVPVFDMRAKFGLPPVEPTAHTRVVVLEVAIGGRMVVVGALMDRVFEVTALDAGGVEPPPEVGVRWNSDLIRGIGRRNQQFVIILDPERVFATEDVAAVLGSAMQ
jgi:purine-binding chemotaxis protein CheW